MIQITGLHEIIHEVSKVTRKNLSKACRGIKSFTIFHIIHILEKICESKASRMNEYRILVQSRVSSVETPI